MAKFFLKRYKKKEEGGSLEFFNSLRGESGQKEVGQILGGCCTFLASS